MKIYNLILIGLLLGTSIQLFCQLAMFLKTLSWSLNIKKRSRKLGGVAIYSGGLPAAAATLIDKENPVYVSDMYDPRSYKYKQFLIRTANDNIWIELCHGLNTQKIDLTVVRVVHVNENVQ